MNTEKDGEVKKQHYVPRLLLRKFSCDENHKLLNIYLVNKKINVPVPGPISNQSYEDYLYGKDQKLEKSFGKIEDPFERILEKLLTENTNLTAEEENIIKLFVNFQHSRTPEIAKKYEGAFEGLLKLNISNSTEVSEDEYKIKITKIYDLLYNIAKQTNDTLKELNICLLKAPINRNFVLGQNPVTIINPFLDVQNYEFSKTGIGYKGVMIILPISFKYSILIYDDKVYNKIEKINQLTEDDINLLNKIQFYNTENCIYYKNLDLELFNQYADESNDFRNNPKFEIREINVKLINGEIKPVVNQHINDLPINATLSFITLTEEAKNMKIKGIKDAIRDECNFNNFMR